jgi:hypothetical protein
MKNLWIYAAVGVGGFILGREVTLFRLAQSTAGTPVESAVKNLVQSRGLSGLGRRQSGPTTWQALSQQYGQNPWQSYFGPLHDSEMAGPMLSPWSGQGPSAVEMESPGSISAMIDAIDAGTFVS